MKWLVYIALAVMAIVSSCGKPQDNAVPRREGYFRLDTYPAQYAQQGGTPMVLHTNACAPFDMERKDDGSYWATSHYYKLRACIYYTFTPLDGRDATALVENRLERMRLDLGNAGDISTEEYLNPNGLSVWMLYAPSCLATPVKFLAFDKDWMLSGTAFLNNVTPATDLDSVAPIVNVLLRDVRYTMLTLGS